MKTKEELEAKIAERNRKNERDQKLIHDMKPIDGWRVVSTYPKWMMYAKDGKYEFGINTFDEWSDCRILRTIDTGDTLATPEESTKRLTEFVNGLGYKEGVDIANFQCGGSMTLTKTGLEIENEDDTFGYSICIGDTIIWCEKYGWAKIVEQKPKYTVDCSQLGFEGKEDFCDYTVLKDGKTLCLDEWKKTAKRIENFLND